MILFVSLSGVIHRALLFYCLVCSGNNHVADSLTVTTFNILAPIHRSMSMEVVTKKYDASEQQQHNGIHGGDPHQHQNDNSSRQPQLLLQTPPRESEKIEWWKPRAIELSNFIANNLYSSDVILLQEFWFRQEFVDIFDAATSHLFDRIAEQRPLPSSSSSCDSRSKMRFREDGMAVLVNKNGKLEIIDSIPIKTGEQRIAQLVRCQERRQRHHRDDGFSERGKVQHQQQQQQQQQRVVHIVNTHLSFPGSKDDRKNDRKQAYELQCIKRSLRKARRQRQQDSAAAAALPSPLLEIIGGDFNSNSKGLAAMKLERNNQAPNNCFVNCASAWSQQSLVSGSGGQVDLGVTHRTHKGDEVSVDHIFTRVCCDNNHKCDRNNNNNKIDKDNDKDFAISSNTHNNSNNIPKAIHRGEKEQQQQKYYTHQSPALRFGYLDDEGTRVVDCRKKNLVLLGESLISDHRPVTVTLDWPSPSTSSKESRRKISQQQRRISRINDLAESDIMYQNMKQQQQQEQHPLEPIWPGY